MTEFRKKPVVIEAVPVHEVLSHIFGNAVPWPDWAQQALDDGVVRIHADRSDQIEIETLEGNMLGDQDDWLIRGVKGELYPCKPDIFEASYEPPGGAVSKADQAVATVARALEALGDGYRADWSGFDGRQLRDELWEVTALIDRALKGDDVVEEAEFLGESWGSS